MTYHLFSILAAGVVSASAGLQNVQVSGCNYVERTEESLRFQRFRNDVLQMPAKELGLNPAKAKNGSGVVLAFRTDSQTVKVQFAILEANYMGSGFGVFENGKLVQEFKFSPKEKEALLEFDSNDKGVSLFEVALPSFADVEFQGLEVDADAALEKVPTTGKPVYVALGDSISHGVGQDGFGHKTWPFLLSRKLDMELYNLAVGGAKVAVPVGAMLSDWERIDLITILVGYNDLHFDGKTPEEYRLKYGQLLDAVRANHPEAKMVCITPLFTKKPVSVKTGFDVQSFRDALTELTSERQKGDANLILIDGDALTSEKNLRADNPTDPVHLGGEGAALFAEALFHVLEK